MAARKQGGERFFALKPTMGKSADEHRLLVNVVSRDGVMERRPAIRALETGYSSPSTPAGTPSDSSYSEKYSLTAETGILEGIDCELIEGTLVCLYLRHRSNGNLHLSWSWHKPEQPLIGHLETGGNVWDFESGAQTTATTSENFRMGRYHAGSYWTRRIMKALTGFMFVGKNVGLEQLGTTASGTYSIWDDDHIVHWDSTNLRMFTKPEAIDATKGATGPADPIPRIDVMSTIHCKHAPRGAFAHADRLGQFIWYGFSPFSAHDLNFDLDPDNILNQTPSTDQHDTDKSVIYAQEYDVWYSDGNSPISLPVQGLIPVFDGSKAHTVVGLAEYKGGTVVFTHDTIQYLSGAGLANVWEEGTVRRQVISQGIGADARHTIKGVAGTVAFVNSKGVWVIGESGPKRIEAFDELFDDGVEVCFGPYDIPNDINGDTDLDASQGEMKDSYDAGMLPWRKYRVDTQRLDRAIAAVWDDLYLVFVSLADDDIGNDNRLVLCWNWRDNTKSVWLLPDNMGVRGWAYDGTFQTPFVMTRYGLARFEPDTMRDSRHVVATTSADDRIATVTTSIDGTKPIPPVIGQTHKYPETGDSFCAAHFVITHETAINSEEDVDYKMRVQMWGALAEIAMCKTTPDTAMMNNTDMGTLDGLYKGAFNSYLAGDQGDFKLAPDDDSTRLARGPFRRRSAARSGWNDLRHTAQFVTLNPGKILKVDLGLIGVAQRGERA